MRIVQIRDGRLELRWTWLPYWLAQNPKIKTDIERRLRDAVLVNGMTNSERDLDAMHRYVIKLFGQTFPYFKGLDAFLDGIRKIEES